MNLTFLTETMPLADLEILVRLFFSVFVGAVIGVEREYKNRPAGMRTHVLVCLGSATVAIMEGLIFTLMRKHQGDPAVSFTVGRMSAQVISGIGFLGAGTIFTLQKKILGLTTAASLWNAACLGLLIGYGYYWLSLILCGFVLLVLMLLQRIIHVNAIKRVEVRFRNREETLPMITGFLEKNNITVLDIDFHVESFAEDGIREHSVYTNLYTLHLPPNIKYSDIVLQLSEYANIEAVRTRNT